jgi:hypothetical protein
MGKKLLNKDIQQETLLDKVYALTDPNLDAFIGSDTLDEDDKVIKKGKPQRVQYKNLWYGYNIEKGKEPTFRVYKNRTTRTPLWETEATMDGKGYVKLLMYLGKTGV